MRVLVLSGGGSKGAFQLGVLDQLYQQPNFWYDAIFGVSTGALTGAMLAQGVGPVGQRFEFYNAVDLYFGLRGNSDIYRSGGNLVSKAWNLWRKGGIHDMSPLKALVAAQINPAALASSGTHYECGYTELESGEYKTATADNPNIRKYVLGSAMQPVFFQLDNTLADGGVRNMTPLADAFRWVKSLPQQPSVLNIDAIVCSPTDALPTKRVDCRSATQVLGRTFEIIEQEVFLNDIKRAMKKNLAPERDDIRSHIRLFSPVADLGDGLDFSPQHIRQMFKAGGALQQHTAG